MDNEQTNTQQPEMENYPLDEALIAMLGEINSQLQALSAQRQGALVLFIRQQKLQGDWQVAENGRELVKATRQMQQTPTPGA
jgi:hypothetical protein